MVLTQRHPSAHGLHDAIARIQPARVLGIAGAITLNATALMLLLVPVSAPMLAEVIERSPPVIFIEAAKPTPPKPEASAERSERSERDRVDPNVQKARDSDRRAVLDAELRSAEARLADLKREYADGNPERRGDERNYAKYQERVAELKAAIARQEADIQALKRELAKVQ